MARVHLVRHATHDLVGKALAGRMPGIDLSAEGRGEAEALAAVFAGADVASIRTSPLERCRQTAAAIAAVLGLPVSDEEALIEIDCGEWTGKAFDALAIDPRWQSWNSERGRNDIPSGESIAAVQARVMPLIEALARADGPPAILVTHSDVIKVVVLTLLGSSLDLHGRLDVDPASVTTLDLWVGGGKLVRSNHTVAA